MQKKAAQTVKGPLLILAGAGTGKTRAITYRMAYMISQGIDPSSILGVTFTNKAAKEMRERVGHLLGPKSKMITLSTFHSLCVRILQKEIDKLGFGKNFSIYDTSDQMSIIRHSLKYFHIKDDKKFDRSEILSKITFLKNQGIGPERFQGSIYFDENNPYDIATEYCFQEYEEKMKFYNAIDFDDILSLTVTLFEKFPEVATKYSKKFQYIMIDEYQDTNPMQLKITHYLAKDHENICVVGDDDQSIYAFRGADISNILNFEKLYPNGLIIKLEENYRSLMPILNLSNRVIKENFDRKDKTLFSKKESALKPYLWACGDSEHEAAVLAEDVKKNVQAGIALSDMAFLYRSNTQVQILEEGLRINNIPYTILGGQKFYEKKEIKDLIAYLSLIDNPSDEISLRRILNVPARGIGTATLKKYLDRSSSSHMNVFKTMKLMPSLDPQRATSISSFTELILKYQAIFTEKSLDKALESLISEISYFDFIDKDYDSAKLAEVKKNDVIHFIDAAKRFVQYEKDRSVLKKFLEKLLLQDNQDEETQENQKKEQLTLMTLHSSKGLEFKYVYLVGAEEELLPHKKVITNGENIEEERRLFYVGITRARERLIMTYAKERTLYGKKQKREISRFLKPLMNSELFIHQDRTTFEHLSAEELQSYKDNFFKDILSKLD